MASDGPAVVDRQAVVAAKAERLEALHALLAGFWTRADRSGTAAPASGWRLRFATAVAEIATNIVRHAYPPGVAPGTLRLRLRVFSHRIEARFTDGGAPFTQRARLGDPPSAARPAGAEDAATTDPAPAPDRLDDLVRIPEGGYGLRLARAAVDELTYARTRTGRNMWRLIKRF